MNTTEQVAAPVSMCNGNSIPIPTADDLQLMQGFPPPELRRVTLENWLEAPYQRWSFQRTRQIVATTPVSRLSRDGDGQQKEPAIHEFPCDLQPKLEQVTFDAPNHSDMTVEQMLYETYTDGFLVLHDGKIVLEKYFNGMRPDTPHLMMSVTKSFVGTLAASLACSSAGEEPRIDPAAPVIDYMPELAGSAYRDATLREVMDMRIGVKYSEDYADPNAEIWDYSRSMNLLPRGDNYQGPKHQLQFLTTLHKQGEHGQKFGYKTVNTDVLAWIIRRQTDSSFAEYLSTAVWSKLGCEHDAYMIVDPIGAEFAGGGLNATLRDLGRFGQMIVQRGNFNGQQIVPAEVVDDFQHGGSKDAFRDTGHDASRSGYSYRNQWWVTHNDHEAFSAIGVHGQRIYIDPKANMVIVKVSSFPVASDWVMDSMHAKSFHAIAETLVDTTRK